MHHTLSHVCVLLIYSPLLLQGMCRFFFCLKIHSVQCFVMGLALWIVEQHLWKQTLHFFCRPRMCQPGNVTQLSCVWPTDSPLILSKQDGIIWASGSNELPEALILSVFVPAPARVTDISATSVFHEEKSTQQNWQKAESFSSKHQNLEKSVGFFIILEIELEKLS